MAVSSANSAFVRLMFESAQWSGRTVSLFRPVVRSKNHDRLLAEPIVPQGIEDSPRAPVDALNHIAVQAALALARETLGYRQWFVRHRMRQEQEERAVLILGDEIDSGVRQPFGQVFVRRHSNSALSILEILAIISSRSFCISCGVATIVISAR